MEEFPPGFRFYPTEEELISFYLHYKLQEINEINLDQVIPVVDIYEQEPWHLPSTYLYILISFDVTMLSKFIIYIPYVICYRISCLNLYK